MLSKEANKEAQDYLQACYDAGYREGITGKEYTGRTFLGYYGYLDGKQARSTL